MPTLKQPEQELVPSDFQKWSVLAFRAMDDAGRVLMTIEPESTHEGLLLDQLKETIRELLVQALVLNGVTTRRQIDRKFQFGKLNTDALLMAQPAAPQRKPLTEDMVHRAMLALNTASCKELQPTFDEMKAAIEAANGIKGEA